MKIVGVVAEFNPFHNGHAYLLEQARQAAGKEAVIVCVMSGNWMQRGEPAIISKFPRARIAAESGADLIFELPTPWAAAAAGTFAQGAVDLLVAAGIDMLVFGSESGDIAALQQLADCLSDEATQALIREELTKGISYPAARQRAVRRRIGSAAATCLDHPNNTLAVEYLLALKTLGADHVEAYTVSRFAVPHDSLTVNRGFASANYIRSCIKDGAWTEVAMYVPPAATKVLAEEEAAGRLPADFTGCERAMLAKLRSMSPSRFAQLPDVSEGLENRLYRAAQQACCMEEFLDLSKTKRYTHARLRRIMTHAYLNTVDSALPDSPSYLRVLAANKAGQQYLRKLSKTATLPVISRIAQIKSLSPEGQALFRYEDRCTDLYVLTYPDSMQWVGGGEFQSRPYFSET